MKPKEPPLHRHHDAFGEDAFGSYAETAARFFGTPQYIAGQTFVVIVWVILNAVGLTFRWDPYPFILLNLAFSLQAAYAAPLILLAATRQAERDKVAVAHSPTAGTRSWRNATKLQSASYASCSRTTPRSRRPTSS